MWCHILLIHEIVEDVSNVCIRRRFISHLAPKNIFCPSLHHCCRLIFGICEKFRLLKILSATFFFLKQIILSIFLLYRGESITLSVKKSCDSCIVYSFRIHLIYSFISPVVGQEKEVIYLLLLVHSLCKDTPSCFIFTPATLK